MLPRPDAGRTRFAASSFRWAIAGLRRLTMSVSGWPLTAKRKRKTRVVCCFQAEDRIRVGRVTGVQTCALPIFTARTNADVSIVKTDSPDPLGAGQLLT